MKKKTKIDLIKLDSPEGPTASPSVKKEEKGLSPNPHPEEPKIGKKKKSLLIIGMAGLIFLGGSVAAVLKLGWMSNPELSKGKKIESTGIDEREIGPIVKLAPLVINLKEDSGRHYLKTTVILELGGKDKVEDIQAKMSSLMDIAILTLSEKRLEELRDLGMKERLKQELLEKMNQPLDSKRIKRIYFDEFLYQ